MRNLLNIFFSIVLLVIVFFMIVFVYQLNKKVKSDDFKVVPYMMDVNTYSKYRFNNNFISLSDVNVEQLKISLIKKFVRDYFEVIPVVSEMQKRINAKRSDYANSSTLLVTQRATEKVYDEWKQNIAPELLSLSENGVLRKVEICSIERVEESNYKHVVSKNIKEYDVNFYRVKFNLISFDSETNLTYPKIESKSVYLSFAYNDNIIEYYIHNPIFMFDIGIISFDVEN